MIIRSKAPPLDLTRWIGSEPLSLGSLRGKVVLLNFWTSTRLECVRDLPQLSKLKRRFPDAPLVVIGIHTPEFDLFDDEPALRAAKERLEVDHPVAMDEGNVTWKAYGCSVWPSKCLIDQKGIVRFVQEGEGGYLEIEAWVARLLGEMDLKAPPVQMRDAPTVPHTPLMLFTGALRSPGIGNEAEGEALCTKEYVDDAPHEPDVFYLDGPWYQDLQMLRLEEDRGHIALRVEARELRAVLSDVTSDVTVSIDGRPPEEKEAGADVMLVDGKCKLKNRERGIFHLARNLPLGEHEIVLTIRQKGLCVYSYIL